MLSRLTAECNFAPNLVAMRNLLLTASALLLLSCGGNEVIYTSQDAPPPPPPVKVELVMENETNDLMAGRPKLVVGIVVDQMRTDYLYRYWNDFGEGGFKRLVGDGFFCSDNHYSYAPTYTGPGHASVYTGTTPAVHGIIANDWFDREEGMVYCAKDNSTRGLGTTKKSGRMSPHRLMSTTIADELMLSNQFQSKIIALSMKDRGAILPAGGKPTGAYWFIGKDEGNFVTSDWYMDTLPAWVVEFNNRKLSEQYVSQGWDLLKDVSAYDESYIDNNPYEAPYEGQTRAAFPYDWSDITENRYNLIKGSPHGATISIDFAIAAMEAEEMGQDDQPDLLAISISNTDYAGHQFGPQSVEVQDTYLRLDLEIKRLLDYLDANVGEGEYTIFLTADHGGAPVPSYMESNKMPGGYWKAQAMLDDVDTALQAEFGKGDWVKNYSNDQFFFDQELMADRNVEMDDISEVVISVAMKQPEVYTALAKEEFLEQDYDELPLRNVQRGIHPQRSGDVILLVRPGFIEYGFRGTTHGSPFSYDTHVPLIFFGTQIPKGEEIARRTHIRDIAPTVARLLRITQPTGCTGEVIDEIFE